MRLLTLAVLISTISAFSYADASLLSKVNNQANVSVVEHYLNYQESANNSTTGTQPGLMLTIIKSFNAIYTEISTEYSKGDLTYDGGYVDDNDLFVPVSQSTRNSIIRLDGKVGYIFQLKSNVQWIPYFQLGYRQWERTLPPVTTQDGIGVNGYTEEYDNVFIALGSKFPWQINDKIVVVPHIAIGRTKNPAMHTHVAAQNGNSYDANLTLGEKPYYEAGITGYYFINEKSSISFGITYDKFAFNESEQLNIPSQNWHLSEPSSHTHELTYAVGFTISFD